MIELTTTTSQLHFMANNENMHQCYTTVPTANYEMFIYAITMGKIVRRVGHCYVLIVRKSVRYSEAVVRVYSSSRNYIEKVALELQLLII